MLFDYHFCEIEKTEILKKKELWNYKYVYYFYAWETLKSVKNGLLNFKSNMISVQTNILSLCWPSIMWTIPKLLNNKNAQIWEIYRF